MKVCLAPTHLLWNVRLGGHAWVFLNWALGLQALGCEIILLEKARRDIESSKLQERLQRFRSHLSDLGLHADVALVPRNGGCERSRSERETLSPHALPLEAAFEEADLFLNFRYSLPADVVGGFRRSALIDIDPGLLQIWIHEGHVHPAPHDIHFSIGETVGRPWARFPDCSIDWHYAPPPVFLPAWPVTRAPDTAPYTTVTNWWGEYEVIGGKMVNNEKRTNFLKFLDLPSRTQARLELAIYQESYKYSDIPFLIDHGWSARPAHEVSATPEAYRSYIQSSRGEFSCVKQSCIHLANAWMSDRTLCYLASGKPAMIQHTGPSRFLPDAEGLFRFHSPEEAADHLAAAESDYDRHAHLARALVEEHFDAVKVLERLLTRAMAVKVKGRVHHG